MAVCAAIVGKDNSPKFFCCVNPDEELTFQYKVLSSLDIIDEKLNPTNKSASEIRELYLGQLYSLESCKIYGYVTNTRIKFIIVVDSTNMALRDNEIRSILYTEPRKILPRTNAPWTFKNLENCFGYGACIILMNPPSHRQFLYRCLEKFIQNMQIWSAIRFIFLVSLLHQNHSILASKTL